MEEVNNGEAKARNLGSIKVDYRLKHCGRESTGRGFSPAHRYSRGGVFEGGGRRR